MKWEQLVTPKLNNLQSYKAGITEEQLRRCTLGLESIFKFSSNETSVKPSNLVERAMQDALKNSNRYPDQNGLLDELAKKLCISRESIILGNGSIDVIEAVVRTLVSEKNNVVLSSFGYSAYKNFVKEQGATIRIADSDSSFGHQIDKIIEMINVDSRLVIIDSPTNLSGRVVGSEDLDRLVQGLPEHVILILDEAYIEFAGGKAPTNTEFLPMRHPNVVVTRTFSKAYGLAGIRVGYGIADHSLVQFVSRLRPPFPVSRISMAGAMAALKDVEHLNYIVESARLGKLKLAKVLRKIGIKIIDGDANFILADFSKKAKLVYEGLLVRGFITRAMHSYGLPNHIRITIGEKHEIECLAVAIHDLLSEKLHE